MRARALGWTMLLISAGCGGQSSQGDQGTASDLSAAADLATSRDAANPPPDMATLPDLTACMPSSTRCLSNGQLATCSADGTMETVTDCPGDNDPCTDDVCVNLLANCGHPTSADGTACSSNTVMIGVCASGV